MAHRAIEIDSREQFDRRLRSGDRRALRDCVIQGIDLRKDTDRLRGLSVRGVVFLGCNLASPATDDLRRRGALLFPEIPQVPFDAYRTNLYSPDELYNESIYADTLDARVYAWSRHRRSRETAAGSIAVALHDHAVLTALDAALASTPATKVIGIMGGHGVSRTDAAYREAAELARTLTRAGRTILTGGGPGAMEAANLGASLAGESDDALDDAISILAGTPSFHDSLDGWVDTARAVRERYPHPSRSIGIPTWFYGHEPPNQFATVIAKFFANPIREATLLERCGGGIVFLPGAAGTVSEIFMDACENYYASDDGVAPMVLVGEEQWTKKLPAWQLLEALGAGRTMSERIHLVDDVSAVTAILGV